jgi:hypothetical protein
VPWARSLVPKTGSKSPDLKKWSQDRVRQGKADFQTGASGARMRAWLRRFELPKDLYRTEGKYDTIFNFKISSDKQPYENPKLTVTLDSYRYMEGATNPPSNKYAHHCPNPSETQAPLSVEAGDFVELSRSGCYGTCPSYKVKIAENGDVSWSGGGFVEAVGETLDDCFGSGTCSVGKVPISDILGLVRRIRRERDRQPDYAD